MDELTDDTLNAATKGDGVTVVKVWAPWCGPCKQVAPKVENMANEYVADATFYGLNVDENKDIAQDYGVQSIPTFLIFDTEGNHVNTCVGSDLDELREAVDELIQ